MNPTLAAHGTFDDVASVALKVCAMDLFTAMGPITPIML
jgi:hypothetical protein